MENAGANDSVHLPGICLRDQSLFKEQAVGCFVLLFLKTRIIQTVIHEYYSWTQGDFEKGDIKS